MIICKKRIVKTISYRILGTFTTISMTFLAGLPIEIATLVGIGEIAVKPILYYMHELTWDRYVS